MEDKIILTADDGTEVTFYVIEETRLGASNYLLVADSAALFSVVTSLSNVSSN